MNNLISKALLITPKSLNKTKDLIKKKQSLSHRIKITSQQIQDSLVEQ
jgi:hypothetical protein